MGISTFNRQPTTQKNKKSNKQSLTKLLISNGFGDLQLKEKTLLSTKEYNNLSTAWNNAKKKVWGNLQVPMLVM